MSRRPLIGVPADLKMIGDRPFHAVGEKYLTAVTDAADAMPLIIPALADRLDVDTLLDRFDGLLLTGSVSNVEPRHYAGPPSEPGTEHDPARDALTLPLIPAALERGIPVLAICRGFQELNVALGGTLHQRVHELPGMQDHRADYSDPVDVQFGLAHTVDLREGGLLHELTGTNQIEVNSVHWQGIDRLAQGLLVEATAHDGLVEAFTVAEAPGFNLAVQWHPEWQATENPVSRSLFQAFAKACREYAKRTEQ